MEINFNNYEIFIIDYLDNKLDPFETAQLIVFLEQHPHLKTEFEGLDLIKVNPSPEEIFGFDEVILQPNDIDALNLSLKNYTHYFVAAGEGDLSAIGRNNLDNFLRNNPQLEKEFNLFLNCKLIPDDNLTFSNKTSLKKRAIPNSYKMFTSAAIAASVLILMSIFLRVEPVTTDSLDKVITERANVSTELNKITYSKEDKVGNSNIKIDERNAIKFDKSYSSSKASKKNKSIKNEPKAINTPINKIEKLKYNINYTGLITENQTKNFYTNLYDDIKLSQELAMASREEQEALSSSEKIQASNKTGRILNSIISSGNQVVKQVPESLSGWLIADLGIEGFNLLTNNNFKIERRFSSKGNIKSLKLKNQKE